MQFSYMYLMLEKGWPYGDVLQIYGMRQIFRSNSIIWRNRAGQLKIVVTQGRYVPM